MRDATRGRFTLIFAGGGTGGHLMPGLGVAADLRERRPDARLLFVGASSELERSMVEKRGFEFMGLPSLKYTGGPLQAPGWMARSAGGLLGARRLVKRVKPNLIVSLGGHAALAPSLAGVLQGVPLAAMEQNAIPGKVNRILSWWAREIYVPWSGTEGSFSYPDRVHVTGNPVRSDLLHRGKQLAERFGLSPRKKTLLVMGGSQGAQFLNRAVTGALPRLEREAEWLQVLHSAGALGYEEAAQLYRKSAVQSAVFPFIEDMAAAYALSDLAFCRAGGTTLAELTALGVPAVLVPLPTAANDHQRKNADVVAGAGAAMLVDQTDLTGDALAGILLNLLKNETCLSRMRAASLRLGKPTATANVINRLLALLGEGALPVAAHAEVQEQAI